MKFVSTEIAGLTLVEPDVHRDQRGFFLETYHQARYQEAGLEAVFVQDNHSRSSQGTLRGLHIQVGAKAQTKLVRAVRGRIWDVAVDVVAVPLTLLIRENAWPFQDVFVVRTALEA